MAVSLRAPFTSCAPASPHSGCSSYKGLSLRVSLTSRTRPGGYGSRGGVGFKCSPRMAQFTNEGVHSGETRVREMTGSILHGKGLRIAVIAARFNEIITKSLVAGALEIFHKYGVNNEDVNLVWVPGSFEIPVVAQALGKSGKYDAVLCIGAVVRGATTHYDAVAGAAASGLVSASLNSGIPCIFGVLTCDTMEQAIDRAGGKAGNKGAECALTTIEMASLFRDQISSITG